MTIKQPIAGSGIFSTLPDSTANSLLEFFLYYAAPVRLSPLSLDLEHELTSEDKDSLIDDLCVMAKCEKTDLCYIGLSNAKGVELERLGLSDESFLADRPKGFFWQYKANRKDALPEHEFDCIIKHLRNSMAHGRICSYGKLALFEDKNNDITMRFVVDPNALVSWSSAIEERVDA